MIGKIKGIIEVEKKVEDLRDLCQKNNDEAKKHAQTVKELAHTISDLKKGMDNFSKQVNEVTTSLEKDMNQLNTIKKELHSELSDFKLLKTTLKKKLAEELVNEFRGELSKQTEKLKTDVNSYNELKQNIENIAREVSVTKEEMKKFSAISTHLKETDFHLTGYIKKITAMDKEKLSLMKKVDDLQRLIGKERRKKQPSGPSTIRQRF